jgi:hypothetical protein
LIAGIFFSLFSVIFGIVSVSERERRKEHRICKSLFLESDEKSPPEEMNGREIRSA